MAVSTASPPATRTMVSGSSGWATSTGSFAAQAVAIPSAKTQHNAKSIAITGDLGDLNGFPCAGVCIMWTPFHLVFESAAGRRCPKTIRILLSISPYMARFHALNASGIPLTFAPEEPNAESLEAIREGDAFLASGKKGRFDNGADLTAYTQPLL